MRLAAQTIRDTVGMDRILDLYGYRTRRGFMCCPFHGEKEPSLKVYPGTGGWCCFGCGRKGSVIDFVMEHENCNFRTAVVAIDKAFSLGLMDPRENPFKEDTQKRIQMALDNFVQAVYSYCDLLIRKIEGDQTRLWKKVRDIENRMPDVTQDELMAKASWDEDDDCFEYQKEKIEEFKEEVAAWRRRNRKAV